MKEIAGMDDISLAKKIMLDQQLNFVLVKNGQVLLQSNKGGIMPIFENFNSHPEKFRGAAVADRVIGYAAAILLSELKISELYTDLISNRAIEILAEHQIITSYKKKVPEILNKKKDDLCPMEQLSIDNPEAHELNQRIKHFIGG